MDAAYRVMGGLTETKNTYKTVSIINRKQMKALILESARNHDVRQNKFSQVNGDTIDQIERNLGLYIDEQCKRLPRIGRTVKFDTPLPR